MYFIPPKLSHLTVKKFCLTLVKIYPRKHADKQIKYQAYLLSQVNDAVFGLDENFTINFWNNGAEKMYGYTQAEALGNNSIELMHPRYDPGEREKIVEDLELYGNSKTTITTKHKNGTISLLSRIHLEQ